MTTNKERDEAGMTNEEIAKEALLRAEGGRHHYENEIRCVKEALDAKDTERDKLKQEVERLKGIAEQCLDDDEENELSVELNIAGKWMNHFIEGGNFPT